MDEEEKYEVPEGFVDQGIEAGSDRVLCNQCAIERLKDNDLVVKVNYFQDNKPTDNFKRVST